MVIPLFNAADRAAIATAANKRLIYLDSNIWISLAEDEGSQTVARQCQQAVQTGKVLFPTSNPAVSEVFEQPNRGQRLKVAELMDELGKGLCFFQTDVIHALEAGRAGDSLLNRAITPVGRDKTLSWVGEYLGPEILEFDSEWDQIDAENFTRQVAQSEGYRSVRWLAEHLPVDNMRKGHNQFKKHYVKGMSAEIVKDLVPIQLLDKNKRRKQVLFDLRHRAVIKASLPAANLDEHQVKAIMTAMPSVDLSCQILADWLLDSTTPMEEQDFHDFEHAIVGAVYADVFVTSETYLFDLLTARCTVPKERNCCVVRGVQALADVLQSI